MYTVWVHPAINTECTTNSISMNVLETNTTESKGIKTLQGQDAYCKYI